jgi:hypothetical protein
MNGMGADGPLNYAGAGTALPPPTRRMRFATS